MELAQVIYFAYCEATLAGEAPPLWRDLPPETKGKWVRVAEQAAQYVLSNTHDEEEP
jgi:hypothetical protein